MRARCSFAIGLFSLAALAWTAWPRCAPLQAAAFAQHAQTVEFADRHGAELGTLLGLDSERSAAVPLERVAPDFLKAVIAAEDRRFAAHGGLDTWAALRAFGAAVWERRLPRGASTIDMQLARMLHPVDASLAGKLRETVDALRLDAGSTKREILAAYVNRLPMGANIYGVEAAARAYFGVPAAQLTLAQASLLAAVPNAPASLQPHGDAAALGARRRYVLERMVRDGYITPQQAGQAAREVPAYARGTLGILAAPHALFRLAPSVAPGVARVTTTLDFSLQRFVETQVHDVTRALASRHVADAAALVIDNRTNEVLAYAGSPDYFDAAILGRNDGVAALRQPGSALKPFLYAGAFARGTVTPNAILPDVPTTYALPGAHLYTPVDYSTRFAGPVRVRIALANSLNVPAVRVLERVGVPSFLADLRALGFAHLSRPPEFYGLGLALGSGEVTLWELARAYAALASGGPVIEPRLVLEGPARTVAPGAFGEPARALAIDMLSDAHARSLAFGTHSVLDMPFPAAVKTGTSSDFRDTWTVGFTRDYTVAVWAGNFDGSQMRAVSGVTGAAPIWNRIMLHLHETHEPLAFDRPKLVRRPICAQTGMRPTPTCRAVVQEYLLPDALRAYGAAPRELGREYDPWLVAQPRTRALRILTPHDGDRFAWYPENQDAHGTQRIACEIDAPAGAHVAWTLNGTPLAAEGTTAFVHLHPGRWTLAVRAGAAHASATFHVVAVQTPGTLRRGFSLVEAAHEVP